MKPIVLLFPDISAVILRKKSETVGEIFFQFWKCNLVDFKKYREIDVQIDTNI